MHPIRFRIPKLLAERPMHINAISKALDGEKKRPVAYHLRTREDFGFVSREYERSEHPKSKGRAIRKYRLTDKVEEVISELKKL